MLFYLFLSTVLVEKAKQLAASIDPSVCLHSFEPSFELEFVCVWVMTIAHLGLKVQVIS